MEKRDFLFYIPCSRVIRASIACKINVVQVAFQPLFSLSTQLQSHHALTPPSLHPAPFHTAQGLAKNPHSPVSKPPPPLHSYQPGAPRTERKKEKKKELHLSVIDYSLSFSTDHVCLPSIGSHYHKAKKWDHLPGIGSYS